MRVLKLIIILAIMFSCSDLKKEAEAAYAAGDYSTASKNYSKLIKETENAAEKKMYMERYAVSVIRNGIKVFSKRKKSVRPIESAMDKAADLLSDPSDEYRKEYTDLMADVAQAYIDAKGNDYIQKQNLNKAIELLQVSLEDYPDSEIARKKLTEISDAKYQEAHEKANDYYSRAKKTRKRADKENNLMYAESWYTYALSLRPENEEIKSTLQKIRPTTIKVANDEETIMFVVNDYKKKDNSYIFLVYVKNNLNNNSEFKAESFQVKFSDGNVKTPDFDLAKKLVGKNLLKDKTLKEYAELGGVIAIAGEAEAYPVKISHNDGLNKVQSKNLPQL